MVKMMTKLILRLLFGKEGEVVLAMLWATKIINGKKTYADVPIKLKEQVAEILIENDLEELITE